MMALQQRGVEQTALHNHVLHESPRVRYMHIMAHGDAAKIATANESPSSSNTGSRIGTVAQIMAEETVTQVYGGIRWTAIRCTGIASSSPARPPPSWRRAAVLDTVLLCIRDAVRCGDAGVQLPDTASAQWEGGVTPGRHHAPLGAGSVTGGSRRRAVVTAWSPTIRSHRENRPRVRTSRMWSSHSTSLSTTYAEKAATRVAAERGAARRQRIKSTLLRGKQDS